MADGDGLAALEVGVAGDGSGGVLFGLGKKGALECYEVFRNGVDGLAAVEAGVGGDLVVAGAGGVEFGPGGAYVFREGGLDIEVDVFEFGGEFEVTGCDLFLDGVEAGFNFFEFFPGQESRH